MGYRSMLKNQSDRRHRRKHGFTLVELMVVVIVIGVLAALIMPTFFGRIGQSKQAVAKQNIASLSNAITLFMQDYGRLPYTLEELIVKPDDVPEDKWMPTGVQRKNLIDPWGNPYVYSPESAHGGYFDLSSNGADGQPGGAGENADVTSWEGNE